MSISRSLRGGVVLAVCLASLLATVSAPAGAKPLQDVGILSSAPFRFHVDREIFAPTHGAPDDSRVFAPGRSMQRTVELPTLAERFERDIRL